MENDLFYELLQEAFSKKIISYPIGREESYNQGVLACKSILHDIQKRGFRNKDVAQVVRCKDCNKRDVCRTSNIWATPPEDDWFCADGERRNDD